MSYQHSKVIEGAIGSKSSSEKSLSYQNAAKIDNYLENQCTNKQLEVLQEKLDTITREMQSENEKSDMAN